MKPGDEAGNTNRNIIEDNSNDVDEDDNINRTNYINSWIVEGFYKGV